ncbi:MAG: DUF4157 domain-containing protein [Nostoc sp.]|uniref:eCIS core domain-containing protein n=1 Tax=Nostoc sp. TaxID=1180 RepID=UPI002FF5A04C
MTSKRIAQTNQQQKSEKPQVSGILQRVAVRSVSDAGVQSTEDIEAHPLSNSAFCKDFSRVPISTTKPQPIMAKLMIGAVGDKYEQEADRVASQVVQQINTPSAAQSTQGKSLQSQEAAQEEKQTKPSIFVLQRSPLPTQAQLKAMPEDEELQTKSIIQHRQARGGGEASTDVESAINSSRGRGQLLDAGLQQSMGQVMGADFSGVKVHIDSQADQLNQSIQAKAFTTGQDVFFRQGAYEPGSRGGQELIAHELTHVMQQGGEAMGMRKPVMQFRDLMVGDERHIQRNAKYKVGEVEEVNIDKHLIEQALSKCSNLIPADKKNQVLGILIKENIKSQFVYEDRDKFEKAIETRVSNYMVKLKSSEKSSIIGKRMEQAAASSSSGEQSQSGGQDVIWRAIPRETLNELKVAMNEKYKDINIVTDFDFMRSFKSFQKETWYQKYVKASPTPIDVHGENFLTLVGGGSKFKNNGDNGEEIVLEKSAQARIKELIKVCNALKMEPRYVFNEKSVNEAMAKTVKNQYSELVVTRQKLE